MGNGPLLANSFALLAQAFPPFSVKMNIAFAFLGFCAPAGYIFGGLIGSAFAENAMGLLVLGDWLLNTCSGELPHHSSWHLLSYFRT